MLDYDPRVMGIEIYNDYSAKKDWGEVVFAEGRAEDELGCSVNLWDRVLSTGRRCWGFCVPDHSAKTSNWPGRCILLLDEFSDHAAMRAYRNGMFIACHYGTGVCVESLDVSERGISVTLDSKSDIYFISAQGRTEIKGSTSASYAIREGDVYVRVEVRHESGERLYLQSVIL
jgi:hypothetical protein